MHAVIQTLSELVRINSVNPAYENGAPEAAIQEHVTGFFRAHGMETWAQEVFPGRPNVIGRVPGRLPGRRLVFEAHCDTASIAGMTIPPFDPEIRGGRMYGRGTCDTKAGLAAMLHALAEVKNPPCEIWVVSAMDEEHGFRGVLKLCEGLDAAGAVVAEPTSLRAVIATKGVLRWRMFTRGKAAHSSKPHLGVNAIYAMARVLEQVESENQRLAAVEHPLVGPGTISVGLIGGGTQVNVVPESCWIEVDRRLIPGEEPDAVFADYRSRFAVEFSAPTIRDAPLDTPANSAIARVAHEVLGTPPEGVPYGSDASKLSRAGVPSIVLGPGHIDQAHTAEEWVVIEEVEQAVEIYRRIMESFE